MADVATPGLAYRAMAEHWDLPETLMGGTLAMRAAGRRYLPQEPRESDAAYATRLGRSVLFNGFRRTVRVLAGRPFGRPAVLGAGTHPALAGMAGDVDLAGRDLTGFARDLLSDMLVYGKAHVLVDFPPVAGTLSRAEERDRGIRPYFVRVAPPALIAWRGRRAGGVERLARIRVRERTVEPDGSWGEAEVERVRVVHPDRFELWRRAGDGAWRLSETFANTLGRVPLVTVYANRTGLLSAQPPLEDLAHLNLRHWQSQSDQDHILHVARVPILFGAGFDEEDVRAAEIGPNRMIRSSDPSARLGYVEHGGRAIGAGRADLAAIEERMTVMGADLLVRRPGTETATARAIDAAESLSDLQAMVRGLEAGLERAFGHAAAWLGLAGARAEVAIDQDFGLGLREASDVEALLAARRAGEITRRTFLAEVQRRGVLADTLDLEAELRATGEGAPEPAAAGT